MPKIIEITRQLFVEGFSKLTLEQRINFLIQAGLITPDEAIVLTQKSSLSPDLASHFIENTVGNFPVPLGVAVNFSIDKQDYIIPMATEETSIIAAASKTAKWVRNAGEIKTRTLSNLAVGQIQLPKIKNVEKTTKIITDNASALLELANKEVLSSSVNRGGGAKDLTVRILRRPDGFHMLVIHIMIDTCDAMGANMINQTCEFLKPHIEKMTGEKVGLCILSNFTDQKITEAHIIIHNIDPELGEAIEEASLFAQIDPYRAATNNKGILNAVDSILLATGNDWRAVEAGMHAYASRSGTYTALSQWYMKDADLHGVLRGPIAVGIVGGVTRLHPVADIALNILGAKSAQQLARIIAAVGLVQNLGALNALVTHGIIQGHMRLHASNMAIAAGATEQEIPIIIKKLEMLLATNKYLTSSDVKKIIADLRNSVFPAANDN